MKFYFFMGLVALGMFSGSSQQTLSGTVTDSEQNSPLEQVAVYLPQLDKGSVTDSLGRFEIKGIIRGNYKLVASFIGYKTFSTTILVDGTDTSVDITLQPSAIEMDEVIVSTPFHKLQRENVMKVEQARITELKASGSITLADGITKIPGVESVSTGMGIGKPVIRGLSSNRVLVYTQGIRLENQQFGDEHGLGINDAGIESVEVIKGPASLLYGSDALGGVLYINPEKFALPASSEGDAGITYFTNTRGITADAGYRASGEKLKFLLRAATTTHTDYKGGDGVLVTNSRFREYDLKTGLGFQSNIFKSELRYNFNRSDLGIPEGIEDQSRERSPATPFQELENHILSSSTELFLNKSSLQLTMGYIFNNRKEFEEDEPEVPALHMHLSTFNYNLQYHLPRTEKLETIVGIQGMFQDNENLGEEILIPDATTRDFGLLATSHLHFNSSDMQLGVRYDIRALDSSAVPGEDGGPGTPAIDRNFNSFNAALGYRLDIGNHMIGRINLASGFRAPNLAELASEGVHEGTNRYEVGNASLDTEKNFQADLALEYENEHFEYYINGFYNRVSDYIYLEPDGTFVGEEAVYNYQQQDARLYGGEIGLHVHPHPLDWLHLESSFETVRGELDAGGNLPLIPANSITNTLRGEFGNMKGILNKSYAYIGIVSFFKQSRVSMFETPTDGYSLLNAGIGKEVSLLNQPLTLRLSANNLLDKAYVSHLSRLKPDGISNIGRNISFGMRMAF